MQLTVGVVGMLWRGVHSSQAWDSNGLATCHGYFVTVEHACGSCGMLLLTADLMCIGNRNGAVKGTPDFEAMDTNGNGETDASDDPFGPYYPGDRPALCQPCFATEAHMQLHSRAQVPSCGTSRNVLRCHQINAQCFRIVLVMVLSANRKLPPRVPDALHTRADP